MKNILLIVLLLQIFSLLPIFWINYFLINRFIYFNFDFSRILLSLKNKEFKNFFIFLILLYFLIGILSLNYLFFNISSLYFVFIWFLIFVLFLCSLYVAKDLYYGEVKLINSKYIFFLLWVFGLEFGVLLYGHIVNHFLYSLFSIFIFSPILIFLSAFLINFIFKLYINSFLKNGFKGKLVFVSRIFEDESDKLIIYGNSFLHFGLLKQLDLAKISTEKVEKIIIVNDERLFYILSDFFGGGKYKNLAVFKGFSLLYLYFFMDILEKLFDKLELYYFEQEKEFLKEYFPNIYEYYFGENKLILKSFETEIKADWLYQKKIIYDKEIFYVKRSLLGNFLISFLGLKDNKNKILVLEDLLVEMKNNEDFLVQLGKIVGNIGFGKVFLILDNKKEIEFIKKGILTTNFDVKNLYFLGDLPILKTCEKKIYLVPGLGEKSYISKIN